MIAGAEVGQRFFSAWDRLVGSLWFLPGCIVLVFLAAAIALVELSMLLDPAAIERFPRVFEATPESARSILSAIAGSVITVAGVTFSVMVVAVSQASSQYTPRVLRNFMRDRASQLTLGVLIGVFVYCLLVLRTVRSESASLFVPAIAVSVALLLAFIAVALLMYFIHHIASTLEAGSIVASISAETMATVDRLFAEELREDEDDADCEDDEQPQNAGEWRAIVSLDTGYIQSIDDAELLRLAAEHRTVIRMAVGVGEFVSAAHPLAWISEVRESQRLGAKLPDLYHCASFRTVHQDVAFGIRQIVDIALKGLSPSVNDVTTAVTCVQYLTAVMLRAAPRRIPGRMRFHDGELRVIARGPSFSALLDEAFDEIRRDAAGNARVLSKLASSLDMIAQAVRSETRHSGVRRHVMRLQSAMQCDPQLAEDCADALAACSRVLSGRDA